MNLSKALFATEDLTENLVILSDWVDENLGEKEAVYMRQAAEGMICGNWKLQNYPEGFDLYYTNESWFPAFMCLSVSGNKVTQSFDDPYNGEV